MIKTMYISTAMIDIKGFRCDCIHYRQGWMRITAKEYTVIMVMLLTVYILSRGEVV
jgi:hypothetical protein